MTSFATFLPKILKWTEIIGLVITAIAILLKGMQYQGAPEMLMLGLMTLAATYFLSAYVMVHLPKDTATKLKGFADLLVTILRKLMFIGLSVFCVALLFTFLNYPGANEMMMIGLLTTAAGTGFSMILIMTKRERMLFLQAPLIRCIAALVVYFIIAFLR